ncbi:MAG: class I SAM-dependent methyltransferase, partial [Rickettsiales bacterium]|nr:class I SAM-dependent methyltransferase [Rickettsiales bacterium]
MLLLYTSTSPLSSIFKAAHYKPMDPKKTPSLPTDRHSAFQALHTGRFLGAYETTSGKGSTLMATRHLRKSLQPLIDAGLFPSIHDIGCGDFFWLSHLNLENVVYTGTDLLPDIIALCEKYQTPQTRFRVEDIVETTPALAALVLARDVFTHFPHADILAALAHIRESGSTYFACTTHTAEGLKPSLHAYMREHTNKDINPGEWRPVDLRAAPYRFPPPLYILPETDPGKSLMIWRTASIPTPHPHTPANPSTPEDFARFDFFRRLTALPFV